MSDLFARKSRMDFYLGQASDPDHFVSGTLALENFELSLGKIEEVRQEREAGGVGRALHRQGHQPNVQDVSGPADDRVTRGSWLDTEGEGDVRPGNPLTGCG